MWDHIHLSGLWGQARLALQEFAIRDIVQYITLGYEHGCWMWTWRCQKEAFGPWEHVAFGIIAKI